MFQYTRTRTCIQYTAAWHGREHPHRLFCCREHWLFLFPRHRGRGNVCGLLNLIRQDSLFTTRTSRAGCTEYNPDGLRRGKICYRHMKHSRLEAKHSPQVTNRTSAKTQSSSVPNLHIYTVKIQTKNGILAPRAYNIWGPRLTWLVFLTFLIILAKRGVFEANSAWCGEEQLAKVAAVWSEQAVHTWSTEWSPQDCWC